MGNVTVFRDWDNVPDEEVIKSCYLEQHPDARRWLPHDDKAAHIVSLFPLIGAMTTEQLLAHIGILGTL